MYLSQNNISDSIFIKGFLDMEHLTIINQSITDVFIMDFMYDRYGNSQTLYEFLPSMRKISRMSSTTEQVPSTPLISVLFLPYGVSPETMA